MRIGITFLLISSLFLSLSCDKKRNSKSHTDKDVFSFDNTLFDTETLLAPNKYEIIVNKDSFNSSDLKDYYSINANAGCTNNSSPTLETNLQENDSFTVNTIESNASGSISDSETYSSSKVENNKVSYSILINYLKNMTSNNSFDIKNSFSSSPHGTLTYEDLSFEGNVHYNDNGKVSEFKKKTLLSQNTWKCNFIEESNKTIMAFINYEFNGSKVPAIITESTSLGKMRCEKSSKQLKENEISNISVIEFSNSKFIWKSIKSRSVKSMYLTRCDGTSLYYHESQKINDKLYTSYTSKTITAPLHAK